MSSFLHQDRAVQQRTESKKRKRASTAWTGSFASKKTKEVNNMYLHEDRKDLKEKPLDLKRARSSQYPPFAPRNKILNIIYPSQIADLQSGIYDALHDCCDSLLNPPIKNFGLEGIKKWAKMVLQWPKQFKGLNFIGCLMNTFIFIEIGGTGGSAFRPMFAQFLREAHSLVDNHQLSKIADLYEEIGTLWSQIAVDTLPDSWSSLKRIRDLSLEKNEIFEAYPPGALQKMLTINEKIDQYLKEAEKELDKGDIASLCSTLHERIMELHERESQAAHLLENAFSIFLFPSI
jgi:hypothetical protein